MAAVRGLIAIIAGTLAAAIAGMVFDYANGYYEWITPKYGYMYFYPWLTAGGGLLACITGVAIYSAMGRKRKAADPKPGRSSQPAKAKQRPDKKTDKESAGSFTSARPSKAGGSGGSFEDVPGMPLDDFQSALEGGESGKGKEAGK